MHEAGVDIDAENNEKLARKFVSEQESKNGSMQKKTKTFDAGVETKKVGAVFWNKMCFVVNLLLALFVTIHDSPNN